MRIIGCDLHTRQQTIAMLDEHTGELVEKQLNHEGGSTPILFGTPKTRAGGHRGHRLHVLVPAASRRASH